MATKVDEDDPNNPFGKEGPPAVGMPRLNDRDPFQNPFGRPDRKDEAEFDDLEEDIGTQDA